MGSVAQRPDFDALLGQVGIHFFTKDRQGRYTYVNDAMCRLFMMPAEEIVGRDAGHFFDLRYHQAALYNDRRVLEQGEDVQTEERMVFRASGREYLFWIIKTPIYDEHGAIVGLCGMATDITWRERVQGGFVEHQPLLNIVLANVHASVYVKTRDGTYLYANDRMQEIYGRPLRDIVGRTDAQLLDKESAERLRMFDLQVFERGQRHSGEEEILGADGRHRLFWSVKVPLELPGGAPVLIGFSTELTEFLDLMQRSEVRRITDELTGLPNRVWFEGALRDEMEQARREGGTLAVLLMDFDQFRDINNALGEEAGDEIIRETARRLCRVSWLGASMARLPGGEFAFVLRNMASVEDLRWMAERLRLLCAEPYRVAGQTLHLRITVGISLYPDDGNDPLVLLDNAGSAMHHARSRERDRVCFFSPSQIALIADRMQMERDLRAALADEQFELYYQPKVDLRTGRIRSVEALVRWHSPERGLILPGRFIPMMEQLGLILPLGDWVIEAACRQLAQWSKQGLGDVSIAVNLSPAQLDSVALVSRVSALLELYEVDAGRLMMEVTESMMMDDPEETIARLQALRMLGVRLSIDDFGTGFSSMAYLKRLPVNEIKLDLEVVAEGVEHASQEAVLKRHGCDAIQGYLYSAPLPAAEVAAYLRSRSDKDALAPLP